MEQTSIYLIILLFGILFGIGFGMRLAGGALRFSDRVAYREPMYWNARPREGGLSAFLAVSLFVLLLLGLMAWGKWDEAQNQGRDQRQEIERSVSPPVSEAARLPDL